MGIFSDLKKGFDSGRRKAHIEAEARRNRNKSKVAKLIEPNYGRIVTLQVVAEEPILHMTINMLTVIADGNDIKANVSGNILTFTFSDTGLAEAFRNGWGK